MLFAASISVSAAAKLKIVTQPKSVTVEKGEKATVRIIAEGDDLTYKWYYKDASSSKYSLTKSFTGTSYSVTMSESKSGRSVYCIVTDGKGNKVKTKTASLNMRKPLKIVTQPKSVTVKKGEKAKVKVVAKGTGLTYKWYYKDADAPMYSIAESVTGSSYSATMSDARNGRYVYCVVTDDLGNSIRTDTVSLNMQSLKIVAQPESVRVKEGEKATVKVIAVGTGLTYKWYYKNAGASKYSLDKSAKGSTYSMTMSDDNSGRYVYCLVSDDYGNSVKSKSAYLLMNTVLAPTITKQPQDAICSVGDKFKLSVTADGIALRYVWQYSTDGVKWTNLGKAESACTLTATSSSFGQLYRCLVSDDYGNSCATNTVKVFDESNLILTQPKNWFGCESGEAFFEVETLDSVVSCRWQISANNGEKWTNSSVDDTLYSTTATAERNGYLYRCVVKDSEGREQISNAVSLTITDEFYIAKQPTTFSANFGEKVTFSIQAGGEDLKFEWQRSQDGKNWEKFGADKARVPQTLQRYYLGNYYRCIVTNKDGKKLTSNVVRLKWAGTGFFVEDGKKYYVNDDGHIATGVVKIDGDVYYFSEEGIMRTGLRKPGGKIYYFTDKGPAAKGFTYVPDVCNVLYFDKNGVAATGWTEIDGNMHYFYKSGAMAWGITQIGENEYFFDQKTGVQSYGMVQVGLNDYMYFEKGKDTPFVGLKEVDGALYYFAKDGRNRGITQGSKQIIDEKTYYFDPITKQAVKGFVEYGDNIYFIGNDYTMVKNKFVTVGANKYLFDSKGAMCYGLVKKSGKRYYLDPTTGAAVSGWIELNGATLYFDPSTYAAKTGFVTINGVKYIFNSNGYLKTGVSKRDGIHYYFTKPEEGKTGFVKLNQKTYYVYKNQKVAKGLTKINKKLYYFDSVGVMRTGSRSVKGVRYYFDPSTGAAVTGLRKMSNGHTYYFKGASGTGKGLTKINGDLYCLDSAGIVRYGIIKVGKKIYYFDPETGKAATGWRSILCSNNVVRRAYFDPKTYCAVTGLKKISGKLYYFDSSGWAKSGTKKIKGVTYFFSEGTNEAYTGWFKNKDGSHSYFDGAKGKLIGPGKFKIKGKSYYIDAYGRRKTPTPAQSSRAGKWGKIKGVKCFYGTNGKLLTGLQTIDGDIYYFDKNGKMKTGLQKVKGSYYYFGKSGAESGVIKIKGKEYYFSPSSCQMLTGLIKIKGKYRYYDEKGVRRSGWITTATGDRIYITTSGLKTGLVKIGKKTYCFGEDGIMRTGVQQVTNANGKQMTCLFDKNGAMVTGLVTKGNGIYYYDTKTGDRVTGFATVKGKEYYFDPITGKAKVSLHNIDGVYCYFDKKTAQRKYGLQTVGGKLYCFTKSTAKSGLAKGITVVDGKTYYFSDASGIALSGYREVDDVMYYFSPDTYASVSVIHRRANGEAYSFKAGGGVNKGWQTVNGKKYYFYPATGIMAEGLASVRDKLYYFDFNKGILRNTKVTVGGVTYQLDKNGYAKALGSSKLSKMINAGIAHFDKGYGNDGDTEDPKNFTCSQLMIAVYESIGIDLPKRAARQYYSLLNGNYDAQVVESIEQAKPGDLIFFTTVECDHKNICDFWNEIHHVGIYMGEGKILESYKIKGDTDNNGPMIRDVTPELVSSVVFSIVRINGINE